TSVQTRQRLAVRRGALIPANVSDVHGHRDTGDDPAAQRPERRMSDVAHPVAPPVVSAKKERPGPLEYMRQWPLRVVVGASLVFLYLPLITLMVFSFNDSRRNIVWQGFTLKYYEKALNNDSLITAFGNSMTIAFFSTIISVVLGALAAVVLWRFRFPGKT